SSSSCRLRAISGLLRRVRSRPIVRGKFTYVQRYIGIATRLDEEEDPMATLENFDLAHLGGIELYTPKFEESLHFFRDICAMREVARVGDSSYLRCWDEYQLY